MSIDICVNGVVPMAILSFANWSLKVSNRLSSCCWIFASSWYLGGVKESGFTVLGNIRCVVALLIGICVKSSVVALDVLSSFPLESSQVGWSC